MRTTDFSMAPIIGQATAQFVGANDYGNFLTMFRMYLRWRPMIRKLKRMSGFHDIRIWYRFPHTLGMLVFFDNMASLMKFARSPEHAACMLWLTSPGNSKAGFIRIYEALPHGYANGIWRAEPGQVMRSIDRFTTLEGEEKAPSVEEIARTYKR